MQERRKSITNALEWRLSCTNPSICGIRADTRYAPSQWETSLQSNALSHWLGANLESALGMLIVAQETRPSVLDVGFPEYMWMPCSALSYLCILGVFPYTWRVPQMSLPGRPTSFSWMQATYPFSGVHDDVIKWKHFPCCWPFVRGINQSPLNSPHKGQWGGALMFSLICAWTNGSVNNRGTGDLRHHCSLYDVTVV